MDNLLGRFRTDDGTATRSTILHSLQWMTFILLVGLSGTSLSNAPDWTAQVVSVLLVIVVIMYLFFYCYFAFKSPDQLRSEKYTIRKMEIERGLVGDDTVGLTETSNYHTINHNPDLVSDQGEDQ